MDAQGIAFILGFTVGGALVYCWHLFATRSLQDRVIECNDQLFDEKAKGIKEGYEIKVSSKTNKKPTKNKKPAKKKKSRKK